MLYKYDKNTVTRSKYLMLNSFPRQKLLRERALVLHYNYIVCLVK